MRKLLYILLLLGSLVQAQFSPSIGVIASQGNQELLFEAEHLYPSQYSVRTNAPGGTRMSGIAFNHAGDQVALVSDNEVMLNIYDLNSGWDLSEISYNSQVDIEILTGGTTSFQEIVLNAAGDKFWVSDSDFNIILQYDLSTADDFTSTITLDAGGWDSATSADEYGIVRDATGDQLTTSASGQIYFQTYTMGTTDDILGTNTKDGQGDAILTTGSDSHFIVAYDDGNKLLYQDYDNSSTNFISGTFNTPYEMDASFSGNESVSVFNEGMFDILRGGTYIADDNSIVLCGWDDVMIKFRDIRDDTYESGKAYDIDIYADAHAINTTYSINNLGAAFTFIVDIKIPNTGITNITNEILGSTAGNFIRFDWDYNTELFYMGFSDGTNTNTNTASWTNDGAYHQLALSYSTTNNCKLYIDGTLVDTGTDPDNVDLSTVLAEQILQIGSRSFGTFWGHFKIKGAHVYARELTSTEIGDVDTDFTDTQTGIECYYYDDKGTYFWKDSSGNGYHAGAESVTKTTP